MEISIQREDDVSRILIVGDIDLYSAPKLKESFLVEVNNANTKMVFNFNDVKYIDSTGIGVLMYVFSESRKRGCTVCFTHVHGTVQKVIELTKLTKFLPIVDTDEMAIRMLKHGIGTGHRDTKPTE